MNFPDPSLLQLLRCPHKHSKLVELSADQLRKLNEKIRNGDVKKANGQAITTELDRGLINFDGSCAYIIHAGIMQLIADDAIILDPSL